jgi:hypothetical protein
VNPPVLRKIPAFLAALLVCALPAPVKPQSPAGHHAPPAEIGHAIELAAQYLQTVCDQSGKFVYQVDPNTGKVSSTYNILRHAGSIYSLAMYNRAHPDRKVVDTMIRAAKFMRINYIGPETASNALAVWSEPLPAKSSAELGATGLALIALTALDQAEPDTIPLADLQSLARFVLFLQKSDGSFTSKYSPDTGPDSDFNSLYYPGEASLGLISLYELDHRTEWLDAAGKALSYLAVSRLNVRKLPPDHWALIATARFLADCPENSCSVSRPQLIDHAGRICDRFLRDQVASAPNPRIIGAYDVDGRTTPSSIRLEGMLATLEYLPNDVSGRRNRIESSIEHGIAFLLRAQITSGPYAGGMPGAVSSAPLASEIRIDYVQHALSAWLRYQAMYP